MHVVSAYLAMWGFVGLPVTVWTLTWLAFWPGPRDALGAVLWFVVSIGGLLAWAPVGYRLACRALDLR